MFCLQLHMHIALINKQTKKKNKIIIHCTALLHLILTVFRSSFLHTHYVMAQLILTIFPFDIHMDADRRNN